MILYFVLSRRSAWTSLGQSWTVGLRPVLWTALSASLIQANSSWIAWNRPRNPSQCSPKAFRTDFSPAFLEKERSSRNEEWLMGWLQKRLWGYWLPLLSLLGHPVIWEWTKTNFSCVWGSYVYLVVFFNVNLVKPIDRWMENFTRCILLYVGLFFSKSHELFPIIWTVELLSIIW